MDNIIETSEIELNNIIDKWRHNYELNYIFSLENSIDEKTKIFTDVITDNICDDIFYIFDTKRTSSKPLYNKKYKKYKKYKKPINKEKLIYFITSLKNLLIDV